MSTQSSTLSVSQRHRHLYACGFNAWNQLVFDPRGEEQDLEPEPDDFYTFRRVISDDFVDMIDAGLSYTCVNTIQSKNVIAGDADDFISQYIEVSEVIICFARADNGKVAFTRKDERDGIHVVDTNECQTTSNHSIFSSSNSESTKLPNHIKQLRASATAFVALDEKGLVWTWGDLRFASCLGRDVELESPSLTPSPVTALIDLPSGPIVKVAAGGYICAAITRGHDLYIWGTLYPVPTSIVSGQSQTSNWQSSLDLSSDPTPVDSEYDFLDIAIGESHLLAIGVKDGKRELLTIGENYNGQLGLKADIVSLDDWTPVPLNVPEGQAILSIYTGLRSSYVEIGRLDEL